LNSSSTGIAGLGKSLTEEMATGNGTAGSYNTPIQVALNGTRGNFFVVTWIDGNDAETYAYELESVDEDSKNKTVLNNLAADGSDMTLSEVDQYETEGNVKISLGYAEENHDSDEFVLLNITSVSSGGKVYLNRLVTKDGLMITLPYENSTWNYFWANGAGYDYGTQLTSGAFNSSNCGLTSNNADSSLGTAWSMNVTEEDKSDNIGAGGKSLTINFVISGTDGLEPSSVGNGLTSTTMFESEDDSKLYIGYMPTDMSTKVKHYKPTSGLNDLELTYFGDQTYAEVFVTDASSVMTGGSSLGEILVKDTEVSSMSSKNLIVVGGSCINSAAATLLGGAKCEADFTTATGVGAGQFLIQSFGDAYTTGKIALLVAGYETADTMNAVTYLRTNTVDTTASKKYIGTSGTEATLQVS